MCFCLVMLIGADAVFAQSWSERIADVKRKREQAKQQEITINHPTYKLQQVISHVDLDQVSLKQAIEWWKQTVDVAMLCDWNALEQQGVDQNMPVALKLRNAPAGIVLDLILEMASQEVKLYHYETKWYVQILTREQMLKKTVMKMYDVRDLLFEVPNFGKNAPKFGLSEALSSSGSVGGSSGSGGGGSSSSVNLFSDSGGNSNSDTKDRPTKKDQAQVLMDLIRNSIEPDIWIANGGLYSSITFFNGMLVIRAPEFVQQQIGSPHGSLLDDYENVNVRGALTSSGYHSGKASKGNTSTSNSSTPAADGKSKVSSVQTKSAAQTVSGVGASH
jgi:hypothetical protein